MRPTLQTPRLRLDPLTLAHTDLLVELDSDPEVLRFVFGRALSRDDVVDTWMPRRTRPDADARGIGYWVGFDLETQAFVGWWSLAVVDDDPDAAELGYRLRRDAWGRGLATEGARALLAHAFDTVGLRRVVAETMAVNTGSRAVLEKLGMRHVRTRHEQWDDPLPGTEHGEVDYEIDAPAPTGDRRRADVTETLLVGGVEKRELYLVEHDPTWAEQYAAHEARIRSAVGDVAVTVEHIGSTSVPGLAAKPIIDVLVTVPDITAEEDYLDPLLASGYVLRVREPGHRLVRTPERDVHVHVLEPDDPGAADYLLLRDHLRVDAADRRLYETTKRDLVTRDWSDMNAYADAKTAVIEEIKARARRARPTG